MSDSHQRTISWP
ncbi:hypothetical protein QN277_008895 [Acacia crassicarpa]|uniref:Uncharacterized protein n=1 Tax=Acacia crassicarpa TaxID=499986 RepID=A0AAE1IRH3_9FABA|nr:hypothetical protein QN277_008895 [Acacia crassicarpa]